MHALLGRLYGSLLAAWLGAAALFVAVGVREVTWPGFDSVVRDQLVVLRFPLYYGAGFCVLVLALMVWGWVMVRSRQHMWSGLLVALALVVLLLDYVYVYQPLSALVTPPGQVRDARFQHLHRFSVRWNGLSWLLAGAAWGLWLGAHDPSHLNDLRAANAADVA